MSNTSPNFSYWRRFDAYPLWECACLIAGYDPRAMSDVTDEDGLGLSLDDEIKELTSAAHAQTLSVTVGEKPPFKKRTLILKSSFLQWLPLHGYAELAEALIERNDDDDEDGADGLYFTDYGKYPWITEAIKLADRIGQQRWNQGQREITARNICEAVAMELAKVESFHGTRGPRSASDIRNRGLKGWKFRPHPVAQLDQMAQPDVSQT